MERVLVVGSGGAGKTTLARRLGDVLELPVIHLDTHFWKPGWVEPAPEEWDATLDELVARDRWIMDGSFHRTLEVRAARADTILFVDTPRWRCLLRALRRVVRYHGRTRPDLPKGCPERFDPGFLKWIWDYPRTVRPHLVATLERCAATHRTRVLRTDRAIDEFVAACATS